jgi:NADH dehydrogenase
VEMAGQIAELARDALPADFRSMDPRAGRVLLVEMAERVLPSLPPSLSARAARSLEGLGVTPLTGRTVVGIDPHGVEVSASGAVERIAARTVIWAAGVTASPLAAALADAAGAEVDRAGRLGVGPDLTVAGHPEVFALGDMVRVGDEALPGLAPVAMQEGRYAGRAIRTRLEGGSVPPFRYRDKGDLATIGRAQAVADLRWIRVGGLVAWVLWLGVHLFYLIGFENRAVVMLRWAYAFVTRNRGARLITEA